MTITVVFDCFAKLLQCENLKISEFQNLLESFEKWLYEKSDEGDFLCVKKSLNIEILDISVVIRFLNEIYPDCNAKVINEYVPIEDIDKNSPIIAL